MVGRMHSQGDGREEFIWFISDDGESVIVGQRYASAWVPAAEISVPDAKVTKVTPYCRNSPLLFDIVESLCAECKEKQMAA